VNPKKQKMTAKKSVKKKFSLFKNKSVLFISAFVLVVVVIGLLILFMHKDTAPNLTTADSTKSATNNPKSTTQKKTTTTVATVTPVVTASDVLPTPDAPVDLSGSATSPTSISLSWGRGADPGGKIVGYDILRDGSLLAKATTVNYVDQTASPDTSYTYSVEAVDLDSYVSPASVSISIKTPILFSVILGTGTVNPAAPTQSLLGNPIDFDFPVTANNAGTITYQIVDSYGVVMQAATSLTFSAAGEQDITLDYITPEDWVTQNDNSLSATATLQILTPTAVSSIAVPFDWANF
jgi:hypothetical protein